MLEILAPIARLQDALREVREIYPRMELGQLDLLLTIATQPGLSAPALAARIDRALPKPGLYKTLAALTSDRPRGSVEGRTTGLGLVTRVPDPDDARVQMLLLSPRGEELITRIAAILDAKEKED